MKIFRVGEKSTGVCEECKSLVPTTFSICSVKLSSGKGTVDDVLAATCDHCGHVVSIPQQSAPRVKDTLNSKTYSIEARLPRHMLDILLLAGDTFGMGNPELLKDLLIRYYINLADSDKEIIKNIKRHSKTDFVKGSDSRLSLKVNKAIFEHFEYLQRNTSLNKTQLLKGIIMQINDDILQKPIKKRINELQKILLTAA